MTGVGWPLILANLKNLCFLIFYLLLCCPVVLWKLLNYLRTVCIINNVTVVVETTVLAVLSRVNNEVGGLRGSRADVRVRMVVLLYLLGYPCSSHEPFIF